MRLILSAVLKAFVLYRGIWGKMLFGLKKGHTAIFASPVSSSYTFMGLVHSQDLAARAPPPILDLSIARLHQLCNSLLDSMRWECRGSGGRAERTMEVKVKVDVHLRRSSETQEGVATLHHHVSTPCRRGIDVH